MSKAEEQAARIRNAKRRDLPQLIFGASISIYNRWLHQGETVLDTTYAPVDLDEKTLTKVCKRIVKIEKYRDRLLQTFSWEKILKLEKNGKEFLNSAFHRSLNEIVSKWILTMVKYRPEITVTEINRVLTYLIHMAFYDLTRLYGWNNQDARYLVMTSTTLANELVPEDSPLILTLNQVYWECRDFVMVEPSWTDFHEGKTQAEINAEKDDTELSKALRDFMRNTPASVMRLANVPA